MNKHNVYVSLDIGTTSMKVIVAEYQNDQMNIIGVGTEPSKGLNRGVIVDFDATVASIQKAVQEAEHKSGHRISEVIVGVPSNQIHIEPSYGMIAVSNENREITGDDVANVLAAAKVRSVPPEREIISVIPEEFVVDGFEGIRDPRGMVGVRLELYAHMITGPKTIVHNIRKCVERAGLTITEMVLQPLANASVAMTSGEREFGTILIDLGGGQSSVGVMHDQQLKFAFVDQEGGEHITKDISIILNTDLKVAERIKLEYGFATTEQASEEEYFPVDVIGRKEPTMVDEHYLAEIIEARMTQIFETIKKALDQVDAFNLPGGIILTGGASSLPGVVELAEEIFGSEVTLYYPDMMGVRNPIYTTATGLIEYVASLDDIYHVAQGRRKTNRPTQATPRAQTTQTTSPAVSAESNQTEVVKSEEPKTNNKVTQIYPNQTSEAPARDQAEVVEETNNQPINKNDESENSVMTKISDMIKGFFE